LDGWKVNDFHIGERKNEEEINFHNKKKGAEAPSDSHHPAKNNGIKRTKQPTV
jgi:hypothetical protein